MLKQNNQAQSEREDLASKAAADKQVNVFLQKQVETQRHELGLAWVERGAWLRKKDEVAKLKEHMDRSVSIQSR